MAGPSAIATAAAQQQATGSSTVADASERVYSRDETQTSNCRNDSLKLAPVTFAMWCVCSVLSFSHSGGGTCATVQATRLLLFPPFFRMACVAAPANVAGLLAVATCINGINPVMNVSKNKPVMQLMVTVKVIVC